MATPPEAPFTEHGSTDLIARTWSSAFAVAESINACRAAAALCVPRLADGCVIVVADRRDEAHVAACHHDPAHSARLQALAEEQAAPLISAARMLGGHEGLAHASDHLPSAVRDLVHAAGGHSALAIPLRLRQEVAGFLIPLQTDAGREFQPADPDTARAVALALSTALESAAVAAELESARQVGKLLDDATEVLLSAEREEDALRALVDLTVPRLADWCLVHLVEDDGLAHLVELACADPYKRDLLETVRRRFPLDPRNEHVPTAAAIRTGRPAVVPEVPDTWSEQAASTDEMANLLRALEPRSFLVAPLVAQGVALGALSFVTSESGRHFAADDLAVAEAIAHRAALAVQRARLVAAERRARAEAETARQRFAFLAEASAVLAGSLDYEATLLQVANLAVVGFADYCFVDVLAGDGALERLATAHHDPELAPLIAETRRFPPDAGHDSLTMRAFRTGEPLLVPEIDAGFLAARTRSDEHRRVVEGLGPRSALAVPLRARERVLGAIGLVRTTASPRFAEADLDLAIELGRRAATAIDNARLYQTERAARADAEIANRSKDEFLSLASHELRTPLTAILGWARLLRSGRLGNDALETGHEAIERAARAQAQLVDDILDVSRIVSGKMRLEMEPVLLPAVVRAALETVAPTAEARRVHVVSMLEDPGPVMADPSRLQQVVWNLLANAVKFTPEGGRVEVQIEQRGGEARLTVRDTGIGIDPAFLPHLFERFRQADPSSTRAHGGLGLGLALVRHLVEAHGGSVAAESAGTGMGAAFTVLLPLLPREAETEGYAAHTGAAQVDAGATRLTGLRVLVVDDDEGTRGFLEAALSGEGARVVVASSAEAARAALAEQRFDVLLSDIAMPGEDGLGLIAGLHRADHGHTPPAIALSAYGGPQIEARALAAGFRVYLSKPIDPADLVEIIRRIGEADGESIA